MRERGTELHERRVLLVEDDYLIALDLAMSLSDAGAEVIGPVPTTQEALQVIRQQGDEIDAAVLDVNLGSHNAFPVADALMERGIRFVFTTGYDSWSIPAAYDDVPRCQKPVEAAEVIGYLSANVHRADNFSQADSRQRPR